MMKWTNEIKVGIMVVVVIGMLATLTFKAGDFEFGKKGYTVKILFTNIDGIAENSPVMLNGLEVGQVQEINIKEMPDATYMELIAFLEDGTQLREGSEAYVKNMGFLGEKYVGIKSGPGTSPVLSEGAVISGKDPADMDKLMSDAQEIATNIKEASKGINERIKANEEKIDRIVTNFDKTMTHFASISANFDERLNVNKQHIDNLMANLDSASANLDDFSEELKANPWKLMYKPK